ALYRNASESGPGSGGDRTHSERTDCGVLLQACFALQWRTHDGAAFCHNRDQNRRHDRRRELCRTGKRLSFSRQSTAFLISSEYLFIMRRDWIENGVARLGTMRIDRDIRESESSGFRACALPAIFRTACLQRRSLARCCSHPSMPCWRAASRIICGRFSLSRAWAPVLLVPRR